MLVETTILWFIQHSLHSFYDGSRHSRISLALSFQRAIKTPLKSDKRRQCYRFLR